MFLPILQAYKHFGYDLHLGSTSLYASCIGQDGKFLVTGGGIPLTDVLLFMNIAKFMTPKTIFGIGSAYGYSNFVLSEIFPDAKIDTIDPGCEGEFNFQALELTNKIAEMFYPNVKLTVGYSPQDIHKATRSNKYDFVLLDGLHTNDQQLLDFDIMAPYMSDDSILLLHDVGWCRMEESYQKIKEKLPALGMVAFDIDFSTVGTKAIIKGLPELQKWFQFIQSSPIDELKSPKAILHESDLDPNYIPTQKISNDKLLQLCAIVTNMKHGLSDHTCARIFEAARLDEGILHHCIVWSDMGPGAEVDPSVAADRILVMRTLLSLVEAWEEKALK